MHKIKHSIGLLAWAIFILATSLVVYQFLLQFTTGVITTSVMRSLTAGAIGASLIGSAYYLIYVFMQTPAGFLVEQFGPRKLLSVGLLITAGGCALFTVANSVAIAVVARILMGGGVSCAFVSALFLCRNWFPLSMFALLIGIIESFATLVAMFANAYLANFLSHFSWRYFSAFMVVVAIVFAILTVLIIRDSPANNGEQKTLSRVKPSKHFLPDVKALITSKKAWYNGIYCGIMMSPQTAFVALWGIPFLMNVYGLSLLQAATSSSLVFLGTAAGSPVLGALYNKTKDHSIMMMLFALICTVLMIVIIYCSFIPFIVLCILFFALGFCACSYLWNYVSIQELVPDAAASTKVGFTNALGVGVGPIVQLVIGYVLSLLGHSHIHDKLVVYPKHYYQIALTIFPVMLLIAAWLGLKTKVTPKDTTSVEEEMRSASSSS